MEGGGRYSLGGINRVGIDRGKLTRWNSIRENWLGEFSRGTILQEFKYGKFPPGQFPLTNLNQFPIKFPPGELPPVIKQYWNVYKLRKHTQ